MIQDCIEAITEGFHCQLSYIIFWRKYNARVHELIIPSNSVSTIFPLQMSCSDDARRVSGGTALTAGLRASC